jgi:hypothetical protein
MTMISSETHELANARLAEAGFNNTSLEKMSVPGVGYMSNGDRPRIPYVIIGDPSAETVGVVANPYFTHLTKPHYLLRLMAKQAALGENTAIVGIEAFEPGAFNHADRKQLADGDFSPISQRALRVAEGLKLTSIFTEGFSLGADTAVQIGHDTQFNESRGVVDLSAVGAFEPARIEARGARGAIAAMTASGKGLFDNIVAAEVPALDDAWRTADGKKKFDAVVNSGVVTYMLRDVADNAAIIRGFGTDRTAAQFGELMINSRVPLLVGAHEGSTVSGSFVAGVERWLGAGGDYPNVHTLMLPGDHSADDNIRQSAIRTLHFAQATGLVGSAR